MNTTTDLIIDGIRDYLEAVASATLAACSFVVRDTATDRAFPQVRVSERSIEEHETCLGVYIATVDVAVRTNPEDTTDDEHRALVGEVWDLVADAEIEKQLSSVNRLKVHNVRCAGPITEPADSYRETSFDLRAVFNRE